MTPRGEKRVTPIDWACDATLVLPGSKSEANRMLVAAAVAGGGTTVHGATPSDDVRHLVAGLDTLGYDVVVADDGDAVHIGPRRAGAATAGELFCGNAGTALRFLVSLAAITPGEWIVTGDERMRRRPIGPLAAAWRSLGVDVVDTNGCPPVRVRGVAPEGLCGGEITVDASASSQFVSSLMLIGSRLPGGLTIRCASDFASIDYARLTAGVLRRFGIESAVDDRGARVAPGAGSPPRTIAVGGDWSAMGVWTCLAHLTGSRIRGANLQTGSGQADEGLADVLETLRGDGDRTVDVRALPDQFLDLAVVAAFRRGTTHLVEAANLRLKECDRIAVAARELRRLGARVEELPDALIVHGAGPTRDALRPGTVDPEGDHRVAMAFALAGLVVPGIAIADPECTTKSYPGFWHDLTTVRAGRRPIALIGMRAAGKSTVAAELAAATGAVAFDTDDEFERQHGPIAAFVAAHGWPAFRAHEERIVVDALVANRIVATGGGAIESPTVRSALRERTITVWLDADPALLRERLLADGKQRPSLTGTAPADEVEAVLARRRPLYADCAHHRLPVPTTTRELLAVLNLVQTSHFSRGTSHRGEKWEV
jgi:3-phosphoshikimate 1-carboxyvinyltransferase